MCGAHPLSGGRGLSGCLDVPLCRILIDRASENPASPHVSRHSVASISEIGRT
jgi:hypothetical protein